jgi:hypothetical protein
MKRTPKVKHAPIKLMFVGSNTLAITKTDVITLSGKNVVDRKKRGERNTTGLRLRLR